MSSASPRRSPERGSRERPQPHLYTLEAAGVLIISLLILILTLLRYWHNLHWSAR